MTEREIAISRAGGRCEGCDGALLPKGRRSWLFEVHHIQRRTDGGADCAENLLVLCHDCHDEERRRDARAGKVGLMGVRRFTERLLVQASEEHKSYLRVIAADWDTSEAGAMRRLIKEEARRRGLEGGAE